MQRQSQRDSGAAGAFASRIPRTANLGFPSIGAQRELKWAIEAYWRGRLPLAELERIAASLRSTHWKLQQDAAITFVPSNDFSLYDRMLDMSMMFDAIPKRFRALETANDTDLMFAMARGRPSAAAMEITKWFDTNYHYVVPELYEAQVFALRENKALGAFLEAQNAGVDTRPVMIGPLTYLLLAEYAGGNVLSLLAALLEPYCQALRELARAGADWVQIDEPALVLDLGSAERRAFLTAYETIAAQVPDLKIMLTTYFGDLRENSALIGTLPVAGFHLDCTRAEHELQAVLRSLRSDQVLSCGVVDGRNIWINQLDRSLQSVQRAVDVLGVDRVVVAPSCSLLHAPIDLDCETKLDAPALGCLAFGKQKLREVTLIAEAIGSASPDVQRAFEANRDALAARTASEYRDEHLAARLNAIQASDFVRLRYEERSKLQADALRLPLFPTTTIGSLPQTPEIRRLRTELRSEALTQFAYDAAIREHTADAIRRQEAAGIDVLVHGEFERNDMVEFFGEKLRGFLTTQNGWVQSYGTRCVKPPIIFGDIVRELPMTVDISVYAQSLTDKPVKGMLTGPITILQWSFVREDQPRKTTALQLAAALRDEVADLERAGLRIVQIDEPALREGLPLRRDDHQAYLAWAVEAFRYAAAGASPSVQIHTHMCYAEFDLIVSAIAALDADVISVESARSGGAMLRTLGKVRFPYMIGPGVYDIHSPVIPNAEQIVEVLTQAQQVMPPEQLWINPDCGLKTRTWEEVTPSLRAMVQAAQQMRATKAAPVAV